MRTFFISYLKKFRHLILFGLIAILALNYQNCAEIRQDFGLIESSPAEVSAKMINFSAPSGNKIQIYDGVSGYFGEPMDILKNNGFGEVYFSPAGPPYLSSWFHGTKAPTFAIGTTEVTELRNAIDAMCMHILDANSPALIVFDLEWHFFKDAKTDQATATLNQNNLILIAKTAYNQIHSQTSPCNGKNAQFGIYDFFPTRDWWAVFFGSLGPAKSSAADYQHYLDWKANNDAFWKKLLPYLDFTSPNLYAPYAQDSDSKYMNGLNYVEFWSLGARAFLEYAKNLGKPVIPLLGLRYYSNAGSIYENKFVDAVFFKTMLSVVTDPIYGCKSIIYWDNGSFGGPGYSPEGTKNANDGTNVWNANFPWLAATADFFKIKFDPNLVDPKIDLVLRSGVFDL